MRVDALFEKCWKQAGLTGLCLSLLIAGCGPSVARNTPIPAGKTDDAQVAPQSKNAGTAQADANVKSGPREVKVQLCGGRVGAADLTNKTDAAEFQKRVQKVVAEGHTAVVFKAVKRHPDAALELLRGASREQAAQPEIIAIGDAYDRLEGGNLWHAWLAARVAEPARFAAYDVSTAQAQRLIAEGQFAEAAKLDWSAPLKPFLALREKGSGGEPIACAESARLRGTALLLNAQYKEALETFDGAMTFAGEIPALSAELQLLKCEASRRAGLTVDAQKAWSAAAEAAAKLNDPWFWHHVLELRPANAPWPESLTRACQTEECTAPVWALVGECHLERQESQAALLAFKQADSEALDPATQGRARIGQARSLVGLNQRGAAVTLLGAQARSTEPTVALQAKAMLGVLMVEEGRVPQGAAFLKEAVETSGSTNWPGYSQAAADLGLAYLLSGDETNGLPWLHRAQARFETEKDFESLAQSLVNEAHYLKEKGATDQANALLAKAQDLQPR